MVARGPAIEVTGLWMRLGGRAVLRNVDMVLPFGSLVAVVGANGAGKTTLLRCLASLLRPCAGSIRWLGQERLDSRELRRALGYAGHETFLYPHLTVAENLTFAARMQAVPQPAQRVAEQLEMAGLATLRSVPVAHLSTGMRRRVSLLRAVLHQPRLVLLDEPSAGLDAQGQHWLVSQLEAMRQESRCVCYVTHDELLMRQLPDCVLAIEQGRIQPLMRGSRCGAPDCLARPQAA